MEDERLVLGLFAMNEGKTGHCLPLFYFLNCLFSLESLYPRYEVYRGYIVFAFSVIMFVCLFVCLSVNFFFSSKISQQLLGVGF